MSGEEKESMTSVSLKVQKEDEVSTTCLATDVLIRMICAPWASKLHPCIPFLGKNSGSTCFTPSLGFQSEVPEPHEPWCPQMSVKVTFIKGWVVFWKHLTPLDGHVPLLCLGAAGDGLGRVTGFVGL